MHVHPGMARSGRDQHAVKIGAPDRPDDFVLALPVRLQCRLRGQFVHHAATHRDEQRPYLIHDSGLLERVQATRGEREVDGAAALGLRLPGIRTALVQRHLESAARQKQRQQCPGEARADDVERARHAAHARTSRSACANLHASAKRL
jgi:hypothetical protein